MLVDQIDSRLRRRPRDAFTMTNKKKGNEHTVKGGRVNDREAGTRHKTRFDIETLHNHSDAETSANAACRIYRVIPLISALPQSSLSNCSLAFEPVLVSFSNILITGPPGVLFARTLRGTLPFRHAYSRNNTRRMKNLWVLSWKLTFPPIFFFFFVLFSFLSVFNPG